MINQEMPQAIYFKRFLSGQRDKANVVSQARDFVLQGSSNYVEDGLYLKCVLKVFSCCDTRVNLVHFDPSTIAYLLIM